MSNGFTKLYGSIINSTIWLEPPETKVVWITMLAMADMNGAVICSTGALARNSGVSVDACKLALNTFLSPDPDSATKDFEGRRIKVIDGGWLLLNHSKYREMRSLSQIKNAERQKRFREKSALSVTDVTKDNAKKRPEAEAEAEADPDPEDLSPKGDLPGKMKKRTKQPNFQEIIDNWRTRCIPLGLPDVLKLSGKRLTRIKACAKDPEWMAVYDEAITAMLGDPFYLGENDRGWKANLDYFLREGKVFEIVEKHRSKKVDVPGEKSRSWKDREFDRASKALMEELGCEGA